MKRTGIAILAALLAGAAVGLDADDAARQLRESARRQRALQAEIRADRRNAGVVPLHASARAIGAASEKPQKKMLPAAPSAPTPAFKSKEEALIALDSGVMKERLAKAAAAFNENLPKINAAMAGAPLPGTAAAPLVPLEEGQLQKAVVAAVAGNGRLNVPQFEALQQWRTATLDKLTNNVAQTRTGGRR
jgi:hypothetical protein